MRLVVKLIVVAYLFCTGILQAQQPAYHFRHLDFSQGLSHNQVSAIYKDRRGFMWFGTMSGLNRYDGYVIKTFHHSIKDSTSLSDDYISKIVAGPFNKLWIQSRTGFNIYDPVTERFDRRANKYLQQLGLPGTGLSDIVQAGTGYWFVYQDSGIYYFENNKPVVSLRPNKSLPPITIADIKTDSKNNIWIVYCNGLIEKVDAASKKIIARTTMLQQKLNGKKNFYRLFVDSQDECWIYVGGVFNGAYRVNIKNNTIEQFAKDEGTAILSSNIIMSMAEDNKGLLWIATDHGGLNILDKRNMRVQVLVNKEGNDKSLSQNSITEVYKDDLGIMWVGTYKQGINFYQEGINKFPLYNHQESDAFSLPFNDVNRFAEDAKGNIWIGTNGGGLIYFDRTSNSFKQFRHNPANVNSLCNDVIVSLCIDHNNILWIGTYYGGLDSYDGKTFKHYRHNNKDTNSLADDRVWVIYEDKNKNLWIGTYEAGLERFDPHTNSFFHYKPNAPNSVHAGFISCITEDRQGNLWVGTSYGIDVKSNSSASFRQLLSSSTGLSNDNINSIFQDSRGAVWVGTRDGLNIYNPTNNSFQVFRKEDGLPDNTILNIVEDKLQNLWISTPNGISRITYKASPAKGYTINCLNYDRADGLQGKQFNLNAALRTRSGDIIFGGAQGFNLFNPANLKINTHEPAVVLTGLQVFDRMVAPGEKIGNHVVLQKAISETDVITLRYDQDIFSIEFAALSYINTRKNRYAYRLEGFNNNWLFTDGSSRKVTYTNLDPGKYTFYVKASNEDGIWNETGIAVNIIILPPFWKTPWAYMLYVLVGLVILYVARRMIIQRAKMRFALEQERKEAQHLHELDKMKIHFLTNVSHEFRTPLTLILTPLEKMIGSATEPVLKSQYQLIHRNAKRLLNLVNQLLDFRKMEVQEIKLHPAIGDFVHFAKDITFSFSDIADKKSIRLSFDSNIEQLEIYFDKDKFEKILFNLLSNAFKFTPDGGTIDVNLDYKMPEEEAEHGSLSIQVKDSGIGIPADKHERIFEHFFQNDIPESMVNTGTGIGLSITREFVKLHNGNISVESEPEKGTCFTVTIPAYKIFKQVSTDQPVQIPIANKEVPTEEPESDKGHKKTILVVEDNEDLRFYLKENLKGSYHVEEAVNGSEGWEKIQKLNPELVVSDIMMPVMDGIELARKIKTNTLTAHIPVILLTAMGSEEKQVEGFGIGINDYITKPFTFEILASRIRNLLAQQKLLQKKFQKQIEVNPSEITVTSLDEQFIKQVLEAVEKNMDNPNFSVEDLGQEVCLSRASLYRKILSLTGRTPLEFIHSIRMKRAAQLLEKSGKTVAEIAYEVGFNNPKHFTKCFKEEFKVLPSQYLQEKNKQKAS
jgi:signal transduction histidine kinase/ligand-binding sensor domain-containing protein/DNA-binding response OmpR family regulator